MMMNYSDYQKKAKHLLLENPFQVMTLQHADLITRMREYSRWMCIACAVSLVSSSVFNIPAVPLTATIFSGVVWGLSRTLAPSFENKAKEMLAHLISYDRGIHDELEKKKKERQELTCTIATMCHSDQHIRSKLHQYRDTSLETDIKIEASRIDADHLAKLKKIVNKYGWPGYSIVGAEGSHQFWLLVQHLKDLEFQKTCLTHLKIAVGIGEANPQDLAYLTDRVLMNSSRPQKYGTQFINCEKLEFYPIEDEINVDRYRQEVGLPTIAEYIAFVKKQYET